MKPVPAWLNNALIDGLQLLRAVPLKFAPAPDAITATLDAWLIAVSAWNIEWEQAVDERRIRHAFSVLSGTLIDWPQPKQLREAMPPRPERIALTRQLTKHITPEVRAHIDAIVAKTRRKASEVTADDLLVLLQKHVGAANGASASDLARRLGANERHVRHLVTELIREREIAVCGKPETGYFIAANQQEIDDTVEFHRHRALHELQKAALLSKRPLAELAGQLQLNT